MHLSHLRAFVPSFGLCALLLGCVPGGGGGSGGGSGGGGGGGNGSGGGDPLGSAPDSAAGCRPAQLGDQFRDAVNLSTGCAFPSFDLFTMPGDRYIGDAVISFYLDENEPNRDGPYGKGMRSVYDEVMTIDDVTKLIRVRTGRGEAQYQPYSAGTGNSQPAWVHRFVTPYARPDGSVVYKMAATTEFPRGYYILEYAKEGRARKLYAPAPNGDGTFLLVRITSAGKLGVFFSILRNPDNSIASISVGRGADMGATFEYTAGKLSAVKQPRYTTADGREALRIWRFRHQDGRMVGFDAPPRAVGGAPQTTTLAYWPAAGLLRSLTMPDQRRIEFDRAPEGPVWRIATYKGASLYSETKFKRSTAKEQHGPEDGRKDITGTLVMEPGKQTSVYWVYARHGGHMYATRDPLGVWTRYTWHWVDERQDMWLGSVRTDGAGGLEFGNRCDPWPLECLDEHGPDARVRMGPVETARQLDRNGRVTGTITFTYYTSSSSVVAYGFSPASISWSDGRQPMTISYVSAGREDEILRPTVVFDGVNTTEWLRAYTDTAPPGSLPALAPMAAMRETVLLNGRHQGWTDYDARYDEVGAHLDGQQATGPGNNPAVTVTTRTAWGTPTRLKLPNGDVIRYENLDPYTERAGLIISAESDAPGAVEFAPRVTLTYDDWGQFESSDDGLVGLTHQFDALGRPRSSESTGPLRTFREQVDRAMNGIDVQRVQFGPVENGVPRMFPQVDMTNPSLAGTTGELPAACPLPPMP